MRTLLSFAGVLVASEALTSDPLVDNDTGFSPYEHAVLGAAARTRVRGRRCPTIGEPSGAAVWQRLSRLRGVFEQAEPRFD